MNKKLVIVLVAILFTTGFGISASAETSTTSDRPVTGTEELMKMIARLQEQIKSLSGQGSGNSGSSVIGGMGAPTQGTEEKFEFKQELRKGIQSDDVTKLQRVLATDKVIYPEGLTTGFFGERTGEALKKFQAKFGLAVTGEFDPKTRELVNKILLAQGAKGEIPMGLLVAPGLRERIKVRLENSNGKFEYKIEVDGDDDSDDSEDSSDDSDDDSDSRLKIEVEDKSNGKSKVKVEFRNSNSRAKRVFLLNTRDHAAIISFVADRIGVTESEVSSVIKFESDDDSDDSDDGSDDDSDDSDDDDSDDDSNDDDDN